MNPKRLAKIFVCRLLERQARRLRSRHAFQLIAVTGSLGKTSTKLAIATVLAEDKRVLYQEGNYNDRLTVPLVLFNQQLPNLLNVAAWLKILWRNRAIIKRDYPYDYVVVELGTDGPGQIAEFRYLKPEIAVITAISPEHMEFFGNLAAVAQEELAVADYSRQTLINTHDVAQKYLKGITFTSYGLEGADYTISQQISGDLSHNRANIKLASTTLEVDLKTPGLQGRLVALAAAAVADRLGIDSQTIRQGVNAIEPFAGRLRILKGLKNSTLIDDSYNASPVAVNAGLDVLYEAKATQKIALLGSMNELGDYSPEAHRLVGEHCDPAKLSLVVTIGADARDYLAPMAEGKGCETASFDSPYEAGRYVKERLQDGAVILAEGSQNGVFAEEAVKLLLANPTEADQLVRQSAHWLAVKKRQFPKQ